MINPIKQLLLDIIDFIRYKIDSDSCTAEEMKSAYKLISEHTLTKATTNDIAEFYGQSPSNVRNVISRWGIPSSSKRYIDFNQFLKYKPKSWRNRTDYTTTDYAQPTSGYDIAAETETTYNKL